MINVDSLLDQTISCLGAKGVGTVGTQKRDEPARPGGSDRLVRTLAPAEHMKLSTEDRFARMRQSIAKNHHIRVRTSNDQDMRFCGHAIDSSLA